MKIVLIVFISTLLSVSGIYILREKIFSVNDIAPEDNIKSNSKFYNLSAKDIDGNTVNFSDYKGKKVLIVNVASKCGYTSQYKDLQELYNKYNDKITILAFPSNNFGFQEPRCICHTCVSCFTPFRAVCKSKREKRFISNQ